MKRDYSLTPEEVAEILNIKKNTVYELIKRGELAAYRVGRKLRVEPKDVEAYKMRRRESVQFPMMVVPTKPNPPVTGEDNDVHPSLSSGLVLYGQDMLLDILAHHIEDNSDGIRVYRKHAGSFSGLMALYEGRADAASCHLWDSDTDSYNIPYIRRFLPGIPTIVIHMAVRMQGFYVKKGNPFGISSWEDLTKSGLRMVNREPGSGTRVLLDEKLHQLGINRLQINGYNNWETSHTAVAIAVARGVADVGLGNQKASMQVEGIEFVPLQPERYELVIKDEDMNKPAVQSLLNTLNSNSFREEIEGLGGYGLEEMGRLVAHI